MSAETEILAWFDKLSKVGFGSLLGLLLFGNFLGIWVWGRFHRERIEELRSELAKEEAEKNEWKQMALGLLTPLESTMQVKRGRG